MTFGKIDAVIKLTERCNINCTYCYMFNGSSKLFESKPKQMSVATARDVAQFLREGAATEGIATVNVIFHGGEPMMMRPVQFESICKIFAEEISRDARVRFSIQTNATLVDEGWIDVLARYHVAVGISIDGDEAANDLNRVDHQGRGTYSRTVAGARKLFAASEDGRLAPPAALCVIDPDADGAAVFRHLVNEIGFKWVDFLLPIETRDHLPPDVGQRVSRYLHQVFDAWNTLGDSRVSVRFFDQFYAFMTGFDRPSSTTIEGGGGTLILTVASDGTYGPDDTLRVVSDALFDFDCRSTSLASYLKNPSVAAVRRALTVPPEGCSGCSWVAYCVGGSANGRVVNRYGRETGFELPSALCGGLDDIYATLARKLVSIGYPVDVMFQRLDMVANRTYEAV